MFHLATRGTFSIIMHHRFFLDNIELFKDLILNKKFVPFPSHCTCTLIIPLPATGNQRDLRHPSRDKYKNHFQINIITRAILIYPELVQMWQEIGYDDICIHYNPLVIKAALLMLFPPKKPDNWTFPEITTIVKRLRELIDLGFKLNNKTMKDSIKVFNSDNNVMLTILKAFDII